MKELSVEECERVKKERRKGRSKIGIIGSDVAM